MVLKIAKIIITYLSTSPDACRWGGSGKRRRASTTALVTWRWRMRGGSNTTLRWPALLDTHHCHAPFPSLSPSTYSVSTLVSLWSSLYLSLSLKQASHRSNYAISFSVYSVSELNLFYICKFWSLRSPCIIPVSLSSCPYYSLSAYSIMVSKLLYLTLPTSDYSISLSPHSVSMFPTHCQCSVWIIRS